MQNKGVGLKGLPSEGNLPLGEGEVTQTIAKVRILKTLCLLFHILKNIALWKSTGKLTEIGTYISRKDKELRNDCSGKSWPRNSIGAQMMPVGYRASKEATVEIWMDKVLGRGC